MIALALNSLVTIQDAIISKCHKRPSYYIRNSGGKMYYSDWCTCTYLFSITRLMGL